MIIWKLALGLFLGLLATWALAETMQTFMVH